MPEYEGIGYLREKLNQKRTRVNLRYDFYEMKNHTRDLGISTPPALLSFQSVLGWCGTAVDSLADRLEFREFANDDFNMNEIFNMNNPDVFFGSAILSALIGSCSFVYIRKDEDDRIRLEVIDGGNATGVIDPTTMLLKEGYAVLERNDSGDPTLEAYFIPGEVHLYKDGILSEVVNNPVDFPLLVPVVNRPDPRRWFGRSRISRANMAIIDAAMRSLLRSEITAEFYSFPQKWVSGLSQNRDPLDKWKASVSTILAFDKDQDGDKPTVGQFTQSSTQPHVEQVKMLASLFAGENGLTVEDLGFSGANPTSAESIKAAHETLRLQARKAQHDFGAAFLNVGFLSRCLDDGRQYKRSAFYQTEAAWKPIFEPDAAMLSSIGDGVYKLSQAFPEAITEDFLADYIGL